MATMASKGSEEVRDAFKRLLHEKGLKGRMRANAAGCLDQCSRGVTVVVYPEQVWYGAVTVANVAYGSSPKRATTHA